MAERQQKKVFTSKAERGLIKDRNGDVLAYTRDEKSFYVDKRMLKKRQKDTLINTFSRIFNKSKLHYSRLIEEGKGNILLEKKASDEKAILLTGFTVNGFIRQEDYTRVYPYGITASHILGYVDKKFKGAEGLEKQLNTDLTGTDGVITIECDVYGRVVNLNNQLSQKAVQGSTVYLTINKTYQKILEEEIIEGIKEYGGNSAVGIIMDPNTGEVLAMTNYPMFDPNNYNLADNDSRKDRALSDPYEPGSTIKPIIMSILLEEKKVREHDYVNTYNGTYAIHGVKIRDTHEFSSLDVRGVIENSSNIGMAILSDKIDEDTFYRYLRDFGFGNPTLVGLPSESSGFLKKPEKFNRLTKMYMSFGYEIMVTPIQLISSYCALINGGVLYQPYIISKIVDAKKNVTEFKPTKLRNIVSKKTADKIKSFMFGVVENGTGKNAKLDRVTVGGKTGTTQRLVSNSYSKSDYYTSFVGFFPVENPKIVCYIMVNSPTKQKFGGSVAAPIFQKVGERLLDTDYSLKPELNFKSASVIRKELKKELSDLSFDDNKTAYGNIKSEKSKDLRSTKKAGIKDGMPNLINLSMRDAIAKLSELGIKYQIIGTGKVVAQSISAGTKIKSNSVCIIECVSNKKKKNS
ncbi:MAG: penicillin-binding protein [bacterium]